MAYNTKDPSRYRWGFDVTANGASNQLSWFKLLLNQCPSEHMNVHEPVIPNRSPLTKKQLNRAASQRQLEARLNKTTKHIPGGKAPVDVVADYMRELVKHTDVALKKTYPAALSSQFGNKMPIKYVLTVPAVCLPFPDIYSLY